MALGLATVVAACVVVVATASAESPDGYLHNWTAPPRCPQGVADASIPVCQVTFFGTGYEASTSQSILFRVGDFEATAEDCRTVSTSVTVTFTIDGTLVPVTELPCRFIPIPIDNVSLAFVGYWGTDFRYVSPPAALVSGTHVETATFFVDSSFTYSLGCGDPSGRCTVPAGTVFTYTSDVTITN
jgi:hypothetical protein